MRKLLNKVPALWNKLPKVVKVSVYLFVSSGLGSVLEYLQQVDLGDAGVIGFNLLMVLFADQGPRVVAKIRAKGEAEKKK